MRCASRRMLADTLILLVFAGLVIRILINSYLFQWDFKVYYSACMARSESYNPYAIIVKTAVEANNNIGELNFFYPPWTLPVFSPFTIFEYETASRIFLAAKCFCLIFLIRLWRDKFIFGADKTFFFIFCLLAFNSPLYLDLKAGNITIFAQLGLWLAFYFFLLHRYALFMVFILTSAIFHITPLFFLLLLLFTDTKGKYLYLLSGLIIFLALIAVFAYYDCSLMNNFKEAAFGILSKKTVPLRQPSNTALFTDIFRFINTRSDFSFAGSVQHAFPPIVACVLLTTTFLAFRNLMLSDSDRKGAILIFTACSAYLLVNPHIEDYSYIQLLVPAFFILERLRLRKLYAVIFALSIPSFLSPVTLAARPILINSVTYTPLAFAWIVWVLYMRLIVVNIRRRGSGTALPGA